MLKHNDDIDPYSTAIVEDLLQVNRKIFIFTISPNKTGRMSMTLYGYHSKHSQKSLNLKGRAFERSRSNSQPEHPKVKCILD